jgi:hypothetical protein
VDYNTVTAWATVGAVIVALGLGVYPIMKDRCEREADAESLRDQLAVLLYLMWQTAETFLCGNEGSYLILESDWNRLAQFQVLYPEASKLSQKERVRVRVLYFSMAQLYRTPRVERGGMRLIREHAHSALEAIGRLDKDNIPEV